VVGVEQDVTAAREAAEALRESEHRLRLAKEATGLGVHEFDPVSGRIEWDPRVRELWGVGPEEPISYEMFMAGLHPDDREATQAAVDRSLDPKSDGMYEAVYRVTSRRDGRTRWVRAVGRTYFSDGQPVRLVGTVEDVTERKRAADRTQLELSAAMRLSKSIDPNDVAATLMEVLRETTGRRRVVVSLYAAQTDELSIVATSAGPSLPMGSRIPVDALAPQVRRSLEEGHALVVDYSAPDMPERSRERARSVNTLLALSVPLVLAGRVVGHIGLDQPGERREFNEEEIALIELIASRGALALENARLYEEQRRIATTLQENLIHPLPSVDGLELAARSMTANEPELVGGDFRDVFVLADGQVVVLVGDVAGKGIRAAGMTETVRSTVRAFATMDAAPSFILRKTSELLLRHDPGGPHVTAFVAVIDPRTGHVAAASAGHPAPVHLSPFSCSPMEIAFGPPLGVVAADYVPTHLTMTPDDCLVLYTDGVIEARRADEFFGEERLVETVARLRGRSADDVADTVTDTVRAFGGQLRDDLQVLVLGLACLA
jgi:PAS domain S-box-containing protein